MLSKTVTGKVRAFPVRLEGVDCTEGKQPYRREAKQSTARMLLGKQVEPLDIDSFGRIIALVHVDVKMVSHELVRAGLAWWYRKYAWDDEKLKALEKEARTEKRGLWSQPDPVPPWKWRKR